MGSDHACALTASGEAYCWGENAEGQLGDGSTDDTRSSTAVLTELRFSVISAGSRHTCGVADDGQVYCWGVDSLGQLGDGDPPDRSDVPRKLLKTRVRTPGSVTFVSVSAGNLLTCGLTDGNAVYCWGLRTGSDTSPTSSSAVPVWF